MSGGLILYHHDAAPAAGKCKRVVWLALNAKYSHTSLAVRYLRAVVPGSEVLELTINHQLLAILDEIYLRRPQVLAISCYIWNIELVKKLLPLLPRVLPELVIVCGGPEVSYETAEFMRQFPLVQAVIRGEGEEVAARLAAQDWQFSDMPGLAWRDAAGELHEGRDVVVTDFAAVPFAYTAAELDALKERILYYETSRGCPFSCSYCLSCATAGVRYLPLPRVMRELDTFVAHDVRQVKFVDRTFNAKKAHFLPILQHILAYPLAVRTNFHFEVAIDYLDEDAIAVLNAMPTSRVQLEIGIQSTNEQTLAAVSRVNHWEQIASHIRRLLAPRNIHLHVDLIIGLPGEGMASFHRSFNDVYALQTDMLQLGFLKFLKGAAMMGLVPRYHYQYMDSAPYEVLSSDALSYGEIRWFHSFEAVFEYYYNAGRCRHTAAWLIDKAEGGDAFAFWQHFTDWWRRRATSAWATARPRSTSICCAMLRRSTALRGRSSTPCCATMPCSLTAAASARRCCSGICSSTSHSRHPSGAASGRESMSRTTGSRTGATTARVTTSRSSPMTSRTMQWRRGRRRCSLTTRARR